MAYIITGCLSIFLFFIVNLLSLVRVRGIKQAALVLGNGLFIYSLVSISLYPYKLSLPAWTVWLGWALFITSLTLLVFSLYLSLPFRKTYVSGMYGARLIKTGVYALVRHPWVMLLVTMLLSLIFVTRSELMLLAAPLFMILSLVSVFIQDRVIFRKLFSGYDEYSVETPMLVPNGKSLRNFWSNLKQA